MGFKEDIKRIKSKKVVEGLPKPVEKAVQEFLEQAVLLVENDYEYIDNKYLDNLLTTLINILNIVHYYMIYSIYLELIYNTEKHEYIRN